MIKNGKEQNVVPTTRKQTMGAAKACDTYNEAVTLFRRMQHANNMGTGEDDFDELEEYFINKQGLTDYLENGLTVGQASNAQTWDSRWISNAWHKRGKNGAPQVIHNVKDFCELHVNKFFSAKRFLCAILRPWKLRTRY